MFAPGRRDSHNDCKILSDLRGFFFFFFFHICREYGLEYSGCICHVVGKPAFQSNLHKRLNLLHIQCKEELSYNAHW